MNNKLKTLAVVVAVAAAVALVGCAGANTGPNTLQQAAVDCGSIGFGPGTSLFLNCVQGRTNQLNQPTVLQQYLLNRAAAPRYSTDLTCNSWGNTVECRSR